MSDLQKMLVTSWGRTTELLWSESLHGDGRVRGLWAARVVAWGTLKQRMVWSMLQSSMGRMEEAVGAGARGPGPRGREGRRCPDNTAARAEGSGGRYCANQSLG
jgi:hypothetical protein